MIKNRIQAGQIVYPKYDKNIQYEIKTFDPTTSMYGYTTWKDGKNTGVTSVATAEYIENYCIPANNIPIDKSPEAVEVTKLIFHQSWK